MIGSALWSYFSGNSCQEAIWDLEREYGGAAPISRQTVHRWVRTYAEVAAMQVALLEADSEFLWLALELPVSADPGGMRLWFIIDWRLCYILACHVSMGRNAEDAAIVLEKAAGHAKRAPAILVVEEGSTYSAVLAQIFPEAQLRSESVSNWLPPDDSQAFQKQASRVRRMKGMDGAARFLKGWAVAYNFLGAHPHADTDEPTPGQRADVEVPFRDWTDIVRQGHPEWQGRRRMSSANPPPSVPFGRAD